MVDIVPLLARLASSPFTFLYLSQAFTYLAAAYLSRRAGHRDLSLCYGMSAMIYSGCAVCHCMRFE